MRGKAFWIPAVLALLLFGCGGGDDNPAGPNNGNTPEHVKIVSISPADGSSQVGEFFTIEVKFDRPVEWVGAIMVPGRVEPGIEWLVGDEDGMTWKRRNQVLEPNTVYQLIVYGAGTADSVYLDEVQMITFTTMDELPQGSISGVLETPGSYSPEGTVLFLIDATHWLPGYNWGDQNDPNDNLERFGVVVEKSGEYRIEHVRAGNYYLYAFKDAGANGYVDDEEDLFGFYDLTGAYGLVAIRVEAGLETTGIDFPVLQGNSFF